jgi:hypothetical protein
MAKSLIRHILPVQRPPPPPAKTCAVKQDMHSQTPVDERFSPPGVATSWAYTPPCA